ncbi:energy transducer TonB [Chondrinema litorale]|uniref:energy transducer TonB n=1 Tax=Chondrinema litorale TaxID=2994555 RepID=UPI002543C1C6|nr:energy transducer TonB [Chondrinema litorale]UZR96584.1 energy transducer TonB [Chondrinema litorale]
MRKSTLVFIFLLLASLTGWTQSSKNSELKEVFKDNFPIPDTPPEPKGGYKKLYKYIKKTIRYPNEALQKGIEGKVYITLIINEDGNVDKSSVRPLTEEELSLLTIPKQVYILNGKCFECEEELVRVFRGSPIWIAASKNGSPVKSRMTIPFNFKYN